MPLTITTASIPQQRSLTPPATSCTRSVDRSKPTGVALDQSIAIPGRARLARSVSCSQAATGAKISSRSAVGMPPARLNISYEDESLCLRSSENAYRLFEDATSSPTDDAQAVPTSNNRRLLARKALSYRNLLERVQEADLSDPTFDVADFCGITWHKRAKSADLPSSQ